MKSLCFFLCFFSFSAGFCDNFTKENCPKLELYYSPYCYYSHKVLNFLKSVQKILPLKDVVHDPKAKQVLKEQGGKLQVPCLFINNTPLYESDHIILWLSDHQDCLDDLSSKPNDLLE